MLLDRLSPSVGRVAVVDGDGAHSYDSMCTRANAVARSLLTIERDEGRDRGDRGLDGARVAVLCSPGLDWFAAVLGTWSAGGVVVPLHPAHPDAELTHPLADSSVSVILVGVGHEEAATRLAGTVGATVSPIATAAVADPPAVRIEPSDDAVIVYTSGTTGRPKGAVHTHASIAAQIAGMVAAWRWTGDDRTMCVLPLNHVHGIVNASLTPLWVGATVEAADGFDAQAVWERFASGDLTIFMAVPTVYARLAARWDAADDATRARWTQGASGLRLMISGSAALPVSTLQRWQSISGHVLLERYGMTELGMVLGNTIDRRVPGHVGWPFPGVEVRVDGESGELSVRGPQVFDRYWGRPDATADAFDGDWFRTGDVAVDDGPDGWRLLGRASVDILKSGGEKLSALEIEEVFRTHPAVADCAVVGLPDEEWGQRVAMAWTRADTTDPVDGTAMRAWGKERLAAAKVPVEYLCVEDLPRNTLGKVVKGDVVGLFGR